MFETKKQIDLSPEPDLLIVGAGLAGLLTAWRCLATGASNRTLLIDRAGNIGGDHTWSFHKSDLSAEAYDWFKPAIEFEWPGYDVHFPAYSRHLSLPYCSATTNSVTIAIAALIESGRLMTRTGTDIVGMSENSVTLSTGEIIHGSAVIDATGFHQASHTLLGYQKFVGQILETREPHGLSRPIIMDATVTQSEGYRFVYCLPFSPTTLMVEDTYYEDGNTLADQDVIRRIEAYALDRNWEIKNVLRTERGILPITLAVDFDQKRSVQDDYSVPRIGLAGGFYNAVTGYSLPDAMRVAFAIGDLPALTPATIRNAIDTLSRKHWAREKYFRLLNRMLFKAGKPRQRYKILERFYRLNEPLVASFYRGNLNTRQKARILAGKPPVPVGAALYNLSENAFLKRHRSQS